MEEERWLQRLHDVCSAELERAQTAEFPPHDSYLEDLNRVIAEIERQLAALTPAASEPVPWPPGSAPLPVHARTGARKPSP
jgi:hypothetical protein